MTEAWIVIPTYNEAENLPALIAAVRAEIAASILVVDDNSPDGTGRIADVLATAHPDVHVLHRPAKAGLAEAYVAGFQRALAEETCRCLQRADVGGVLLTGRVVLDGHGRLAVDWCRAGSPGVEEFARVLGQEQRLGVRCGRRRRRIQRCGRPSLRAIAR